MTAEREETFLAEDDQQKDTLVADDFVPARDDFHGANCRQAV